LVIQNAMAPAANTTRLDAPRVFSVDQPSHPRCQDEPEGQHFDQVGNARAHSQVKQHRRPQSQGAPGYPEAQGEAQTIEGQERGQRREDPGQEAQDRNHDGRQKKKKRRRNPQGKLSPGGRAGAVNAVIVPLGHESSRAADAGIDIGGSPPQMVWTVVKGIRAICRALLMARVSSRWCLAQFPEIRRGTIFPRSVTK
jgi:hypothetical protein